MFDIGLEVPWQTIHILFCLVQFALYHRFFAEAFFPAKVQYRGYNALEHSMINLNGVYNSMALLLKRRGRGLLTMNRKDIWMDT